MKTNKFEILTTVHHVIDADKKIMLITGVIQRPECYSYLCTTAESNEQEYLEQELKKY